MGNTTANLNILNPRPGSEGFLTVAAHIEREVKAAYKALGYRTTRKKMVADRQVTLRRHGNGSAYWSIHDSANAKIDNGDLWDLAVRLSRRLKTSAVVSSLYDSDSFGFLVFSKGKQVDAVLSDVPEDNAELAILEPSKRLATWKRIFFDPVSISLTRDALFAKAREGDGLTYAALQEMATVAEQERERRFRERMARVGTVESAFAEDGLAACCDAAGLDFSLVVDPGPADGGPECIVLSLTKQEAAKQVTEGGGPGETKLTSITSGEDWVGGHRYFPAAYPVPADSSTRVHWTVASTGAGYAELKLSLAMDGALESLTGSLLAIANKGFNGETTEIWPVAMASGALPSISEGTWSIDIRPFTIPDLDPQSRHQFILDIWITLNTVDAPGVAIHPVLSTVGACPAQLKLPSVKLRPSIPRWLPRGAGPGEAELLAIRLLNEPSVLSMSAITDETPSALTMVSHWVESWLSTLTTPGAELIISTEKQMTASFHVAKSLRIVPLAEARADKQWAKLFDPAQNYQTVGLQVRPQGAPFPIAGFSWQCALREGPEDLVRIVDELKVWLDRQDDAPAENETGAAMAISCWVLNDPAAFAALGAPRASLIRYFEDSMSGAAPIQGWITETCWQPEFDTADEYGETPYERATGIGKTVLRGKLLRRVWVCSRLRFVASAMWLGAELASRIDRAGLEAVADLTPCGSGLALKLRPEHDLAALEAALKPILPAPDKYD